MKEISLENFRNEFDVVSDLVVSMDDESKAILRPRNEISEYLKGKGPDRQMDIIQQLLYLNDIKAISEVYLSDDRIKQGQKVSFESYFIIKLRTIKSQIEYNQSCKDDRIIKNLQEKIQVLDTKSAKINFLLEKKRDLEGDYPEAFEEILTESPVYLFLKRNLEYWEKYNEILSEAQAKKIKPLQQLSTNLTISKRKQLFELLKEEFIPEETDPDCFNWALRATDEKLLKQPSPWQSIKWNMSKMAFVELFRPYISPITGRQANRIVEELFLDEDGVPMKDLKSPAKDQVSGSWGKICTIINKLNI